jgi:AAA domain
MAIAKTRPRLPRSHLSVRVPWHDAGWDGTFCRAPRQNSSCLALNRIAAAKNDEVEQHYTGQFLDSVPHHEAPPCFSERVSFLSGRPQHRLARHAYARTSDDHRHIRDTLFLHPAFSAAATPFGWLLKDRAWGEKWKKGLIDGNALAERWGIDTHPEYEPDSPDWLYHRPGIQGHRNQQGLLDAFFSAIEPKESLVFFYGKRAPLLDDDQWILVGAAKVTSIGDLREWDYEPGATSPIRSYLWERSVCHTLRPDGSDGVLLPLQELLKHADANPTLDISDCIAFVPPEYRPEFSYASELVSQGTAISALLAMKEALSAFGRRFGGAWGSQLKWIDERLGELWELRGPYPGLGSLLTALGVPHGHQLAQHAWSLAGKNGDTWTALGKLVVSPARQRVIWHHSLPRLRTSGPIYIQRQAPDAGRRTPAKLLARFNLSSEQAAPWWDPAARSAAGLSHLGEPVSDDAIVANPYLLFECDRGQVDPIAFRTVDQAVFPQAAVLDVHPVPAPSAMTGPVDGRRLRAATLSVLEEAANDGHTLLGRDMVLTAVKALPIEPLLTATTDHFKIHGEALKPQIEHCTLADGALAFQLDRLAATRTLIERTVIKRVRQGKRFDVPVDWRVTLDKNLAGSAPKGSLEDRGRNEKAAALRELAASRLSVLIGAAGTGKTTLLRFLCQADPIKNAGVLLLAPTGKARVRLQTQTGISAKTLAQFLRPRRYREATQSYHVIGDLQRSSVHKTVIVDEASMLTEEQLAALIDALSSVDRIILVGDPRAMGSGCDSHGLARRRPRSAVPVSRGGRQRRAGRLDLRAQWKPPARSQIRL